MIGRARTASIAVVVAVAVISQVACGSKTSSNASPGVGDPFASKALLACRAALEQKQAWKPFPFPVFHPSQPDPSKFPEVAVWLEGGAAPTFASWLASLKALGTPPSGQQAWGDVLAAVGAIVDLNQQQIVAAKGGDAKAFADATLGLHETQVELVRATDAAGVSACADVHK